MDTHQLFLYLNTLSLDILGLYSSLVVIKPIMVPNGLEEKDPTIQSKLQDPCSISIRILVRHSLLQGIRACFERHAMQLREKVLPSDMMFRAVVVNCVLRTL